VKAYLAGKRGICPHCDAKFIVPSFSGGKAASVEPLPTSDPRTTAQTQPAAAAPSLPVPSSLPKVSSGATESELWYVRPASGGQYGPATTDLLHLWLAEGRVADDSWVWRTGWPQWKSGQEAIAMLNAPEPLSPLSNLTAAPLETPERAAQETVEGQDRDGIVPAQRHRWSQHSRRERARLMTVVLSALVVMLLAVLVIVLAR